MITLTTAASIEAASLDPLVRSLITQNMERLSGFDLDLNELGRFVVIEPGDTLTAIETELGFSPLASFDSRDALPYLESVTQHGNWYEALYLQGDGFGTVVFICNHPEIDPSLLALCAAWVSQGQ